jgi:hypothetical protein
MAAGDTGRAHKHRDSNRLAMVETAGADQRPDPDPSEPSMAISIAGVSTACSKDALRTSAEALAKTLVPE